MRPYVGVFVMIWSLAPALPGIQVVSPCPLTPAQQTAAESAFDKLRECALGGNDGAVSGEPWPDNDPRWIPLSRFAVWRNMLCCAPVPNIDSGKIGGGAQTKPIDGELDPNDANDVCLDKDTWHGPDNDRFMIDDPDAACWILAAILLHEFDHHDDRYPWPSGWMTQPHICEEIKAHCVEMDVIDDGVSKLSALHTAEGRESVRILEGRLAVVSAGKQKYRSEKDD